MTLLRFVSIFFKLFLSLLVIDCSGILVIFAIVASISDLRTFISLSFFLLIFNRAPVSSTTSIALSGRNLSLMYFEDSSTADLIDSSVYLTEW